MNDALTAAPLDASLSLLDDVVAETPVNAPALGVDVELAADDYALLVCGCAPTYADADRVSPPERNQALFAGIDKLASAKSLSEVFSIQNDLLRAQGEVVVSRAKATTEYLGKLVADGAKTAQDNFAKVASYAKSA